jgi:hypothetical protein
MTVRLDTYQRTMAVLAAVMLTAGFVVTSASFVPAV